MKNKKIILILLIIVILLSILFIKYQNNLEVQRIANTQSNQTYMPYIRKYKLFGIDIEDKISANITEEELSTVSINELNKNILIYHTHGSESFESLFPYKTHDEYRTTNENYNIIKVGNYLTSILEKKGFNIIRNADYYDLPTTQNAYTRSREYLSKTFEENNDINVFLDVHRDAYCNTKSEVPTVKINGEKAAKLRFVVGTNQKREDLLNSLRFAIHVQQKANELYPDLFLPILVQFGQYNQNIAPNSLLIEVGDRFNTMKEALTGIKYFAEIFDTIISQN